ncbi:Ribosomal-protein-S18p-alanine acetyltransferase [Thioalkalivibrio nitratireducens DSM 14787]|uniref:[Ribosomal protein bS18]-alanine N-acetyltransferase n=1 Tax=Thioalkalivibrio nitratireducens (strain DSM 14787 / UNIQEM 213 / ALEN2) TaxID=1255043 RepID=L0E0V7_THIND|nr:ribosomal protein S18-alanine N-acetyltransferase [Thioalkalivibrio nitratireducens]AGA34855.1 Ribosomal-protein-S18p-alanine acetyltransferase [Thioalkalivibrio nitratireducens DSM 14787]
MNARVEPQPVVRPMRPEDVDRVMEIERRAYPFPWTEGIFRDCLRVGYDCRVLELDRDLVGHAVLTLAAGEAHLLNLSVDVRRQRQGLGRFLLRRLIADVRRRGGETVFLEVRPSNVAAVALYRSEGFAHIGTRPRYYPGEQGREAAWVFSLRTVP